jgi:hypothetical protein
MTIPSNAAVITPQARPGGGFLPWSIGYIKNHLYIVLVSIIAGIPDPAGVLVVPMWPLIIGN